MKVIFLILIIILNSTNSAQVMWEKITDSDITGNIYALQVDKDGNLFVGSMNGLLLSTNGGSSWNNLYPTDSFWTNVFSILLMPNSDILLGTERGIKKSTDGGLTWSDNYLVRVSAEFIYSDQNGILYTGSIPVYRSTDSGNSWDLFYDELDIWSLYVDKSNKIFLGSECGIYVSEDNGINWDRTGSFNCGDVTAINGINNDEIIIIGGADRFHGIYFSTDEGFNWNFVTNSDSVVEARSIIPINEENIFYGCWHGVFKYNYSDSTILPVNNGLNFGVSCLALDSLGYLYAASDGIYKTVNPVDSIKYLQNTTYNFSLHQNYPNPFNSYTKIKYSLQSSSQVILRVFNINGKLISMLVNKDQPKGIYHLNFHAENLASGVYFYQLVTDNFSQTKKMLLLR